MNKLKRVNLADDRFEIVPANLKILNPEREGDGKLLYALWWFDIPEDTPDGTAGMGISEALVDGKCLGDPLGWISDYDRLDIFGYHDPVLIGQDAYVGMKGEIIKMHRLAFDEGARFIDALPSDRIAVLGWAICDSTGAQPVRHAYSDGFRRRC